MNLYSGYYQGEDPFKIFKRVINVAKPDSLANDGALILWGGEDISPSLYGERPTKARAGAYPSSRDVMEAALFKRAVELGMPIIGICRGAQLACALSGGTLFQHIDGGHHADHMVETKDGQRLQTTSCHHQALNLTNVDHDLLAWDMHRVTVAYTETSKEEVVIPEVAILNKTKTLAIQGHPEWMNPKTEFVQWCAKIFKERFM